ncbi:MAG: glycosyltransferase [Alphaproteobacteria bacterium]|nr:glycosyltransferase [Alphaproteobacteria bacterium]
MSKAPLNILIMALADVSTNPRPRRLADYCTELGHRVSIAGFPMKTPLDHKRFYTLEPQPAPGRLNKLRRIVLKLGIALLKHEKLITLLHDNRWRTSRVEYETADEDFDLIFVENLYLLPLAFQIRKRGKIICDAREYYPEETGNDWKWNLFEKPYRNHLCARYMAACDSVLTVSEGLQNLYREHFGIECTLMRSAPLYREATPTPTPAKHIRMVHHGRAVPDRQLETMIEAAGTLGPRYSLDFYLTGPQDYIETLKKLAAPFPHIGFPPPVPLDEIHTMLTGYDLGLCLLEPSNVNLRYCLPNKFFECIQARLAVLSGPSPDMATLIQHYGCGFVSEGFQTADLMTLLQSLTQSQIDGAKNAADIAARELCFEQERKILPHLV